MRVAASTRFSLTPQELIGEVTHLPSAPKVLPRLKRLLCDGNSSLPEIVHLIRLDPGIAARVLQMGNSSYFTPGSHCPTVEEAVHRVGYEHIYELVSYAVASQVLIRPLEVYGIEADELWRMSVACALAAEVLATRTGEDPNVAYTAGLLHNVGRVAINEWALRHARTLRFVGGAFPLETSEAERSTLGFTHAEAGQALLHAWEFSRRVTDPVRWQQTPAAASGGGRMATLLHAATWLRNMVSGAGPMRLTEGMLRTFAPLGLPPLAYHQVASEVAGRLTRVISLLDGPEGADGELPVVAARLGGPSVRSAG
jgi:HD-like signal output (HDOD) protein